MTPTIDYQDAASAQVCRFCGVRTGQPHDTRTDCIDALRDVIAGMEFRQDQAAPGAAGNRGGTRQRADARMVILDGERLTLTEAGRRLNLTASALHFRILRRTGDPQYSDVDLRAIRVDEKRTPQVAQ